MVTESYENEPDFHSLFGRALVDHAFREQLVDPARQKDALREMGIEPTDQIVSALNRSIDALTDLSSQFGAKQAAT